MTPWEDLERELKLALHPTFADRLLDNLLESDSMLGAYGHVADLVAGLQHPAAAEELRREDETVLVMVRELRAAAPATARGRVYGRRSLALVAAAVAMSTSAAWAAGVPATLQQAAAGAFDRVGAVIATARRTGESSTAARTAFGVREDVVAGGAVGADRPSRRAPSAVVEDSVLREYDEDTVAPEVVEVAAQDPIASAQVEAPVVHVAPPATEVARPAPVADDPPPGRPVPVVDDTTSPGATPGDVVPDPVSEDSDQPGDGAPEQPGRPDDPGKSDDKSKDDKPNDEKPAESGQPEGPGKSGDAGPPEHAGRPDDPGQPGAPGEPAAPPKPNENANPHAGEPGPPAQPPAQPPTDTPAALPPQAEANGKSEKKDKNGE